MNYLQLSPAELIKFAADLKKQYGLVIVERFAIVKMDESKFGSGWVAWKKTYAFNRITKEGTKDFITIQNGDGSALYSVTKHQHKCWVKCHIVSEPFGWNFGRVISCLAQLSHKHNLISIAADLHKIQYFWKNLFNRGEENAQENGQHNFED